MDDDQQMWAAFIAYSSIPFLQISEVLMSTYSSVQIENIQNMARELRQGASPALRVSFLRAQILAAATEYNNSGVFSIPLLDADGVTLRGVTHSNIRELAEYFRGHRTRECYSESILSSLGQERIRTALCEQGHITPIPTYKFQAPFFARCKEEGCTSFMQAPA